jgi:SNF2-related domain
MEKLAASLADAQVDLNPHQVEAALFAFRSPLSKGAILADEVGLGKTIEAGILLSQRWAERKRKILIIVPASLRKQWHQELSEKFFLPSVILETKTFNEQIREGNLNRRQTSRCTCWTIVVFIHSAPVPARRVTPPRVRGGFVVLRVLIGGLPRTHSLGSTAQPFRSGFAGKLNTIQVNKHNRCKLTISMHSVSRSGMWDWSSLGTWWDSDKKENRQLREARGEQLRSPMGTRV